MDWVQELGQQPNFFARLFASFTRFAIAHFLFIYDLFGKFLEKEGSIIMRFLAILVIAVAIYVLVYISSKGNSETAAMCAGLAAVLTFVAPYILDSIETQKQHSEPVSSSAISNGISANSSDYNSSNLNDISANSNDYNSFNSNDASSNSSNHNLSNSAANSTQPSQVESPDSKDDPILASGFELNIDKITSVSMEVQSIASNVIENTDTLIDAYNGSLTVENQVDTYFFTPSVTGRYRFEISGLTQGTNHKVKLIVKNSGDGIIASTSYGITNGDGLTVKDMQAGETVQIQVKQYSGLDSYTLNIGNQKEPLDVTGYTTIRDSIDYKDQRNVYLFTPPITGRYRFEVSDLTNGSNNKVNLLVFNSGGGEEASTSYGVTNGEGITMASMQAGQLYEIQVRQYSGYDSYSLNIGYQKTPVDISGYNIVADSIQYRDQKNVYYFTPSITGRYRFEISNLTKGSSNKVNLYVWNSRDGQEGSTSYGIMNGAGLTIKEMQAGETYEIQVRQYSGCDKYNLNVGFQKETVDISEYSSVLDSIQYTDQRNVYTFTPSASGKYRFEIQGLTNGSGNKVNILVFNSRDGTEGSTTYGLSNGGGLEVANLQAGETYQVQVRYYSGYDSYKLITTRVAE